MTRVGRPVKPVGPAIVAKLKNRRILGRLLANGDVLFRFKRLVPHVGIKHTEIVLSKKAVCVMVVLLEELVKTNTKDQHHE